MRELVVFALLLGACGGRVNDETALVPDAADTSTVADTAIAIDSSVVEASTDSADTLDAREASACDAGGSWVTQCTNRIDDDGDGLIDWLDPECLSPYDNDESEFPFSTIHEFYEPCKRDCAFDGNSGSGDDGCTFDGRCIVGSIDPRCPYDPAAAADPTRCPAPTEKCASYCGARTPNGCDCFGCCDIFDASGSSKRRRIYFPGCTLAKLDDPTACPPCEKQLECDRPCKRCDYCVGKTTLPADCTDDLKSACPPGSKRCDRDSPCACGEFCLTGCCAKP